MVSIVSRVSRDNQNIGGTRKLYNSGQNGEKVHRRTASGPPCLMPVGESLLEHSDLKTLEIQTESR